MNAAETIELDLSGLKCPLPVLRTRKALRALTQDRRLTVTCTDPMAMIDIPNMLREDGHVLEDVERRDGVIRFRIRRGPAMAPSPSR